MPRCNDTRSSHTLPISPKIKEVLAATISHNQSRRPDHSRRNSCRTRSTTVSECQTDNPADVFLDCVPETHGWKIVGRPHARVVVHELFVVLLQQAHQFDDVRIVPVPQMLPVPSQHRMRLRGPSITDLTLSAGWVIVFPSNLLADELRLHRRLYESREPLVDTGLGPAPRTLIFSSFCSRSNQNGAPSEIANAVTSQPARDKSHKDRSVRLQSVDVHPSGTGRPCS